jgi:Protein of unknown function (DUF2752)
MPKYFQQITWATALIILFFMNAASGAASLCLFKFLGITSCPGCGLGHAIHEILHLRFEESFENHLLGLPVTVAILFQIFFPHIKQSKIKLT